MLAQDSSATPSLVRKRCEDSRDADDFTVCSWRIVMTRSAPCSRLCYLGCKEYTSPVNMEGVTTWVCCMLSTSSVILSMIAQNRGYLALAIAEPTHWGLMQQLRVRARSPERKRLLYACWFTIMVPCELHPCATSEATIAATYMYSVLLPALFIDQKI